MFSVESEERGGNKDSYQWLITSLLKREVIVLVCGCAGDFVFAKQPTQTEIKFLFGFSFDSLLQILARRFTIFVESFPDFPAISPAFSCNMIDYFMMLNGIIWCKVMYFLIIINVK